ncbi:MAG: hypothetical protein U0K79_09080 [Phascolarctobacterium sp.]|nr:hypothetical protein [Phascolarctobacterium sp.]
MLGDLSKKYESNGNPGTISSGYGDAGGKSYGMYQFSSTMGVVDHYVKWLRENGYWFGDELAKYTVGSSYFDDAWVFLANSDNRGDFERSQHDYAKVIYYDRACSILANAGYHIEKHSKAMKDVVWSRAIQYGPYQINQMFDEACCGVLGYFNLSYVDDIAFDKSMIEAIYLEVCSTPDWTNGSPSLREGLYNRFASECDDAIKMLHEELNVE